MEKVTVEVDATIMDRLERAYHGEQVRRSSAVAFAIGPKEYLQFCLASTSIQRIKEGGLMKPLSFRGLPIYVRKEPGISFLYGEDQASRLAWELDNNQKGNL